MKIIKEDGTPNVRDVSQVLNHKARRKAAQRKAKTQTCSKHIGSRLIVKGTQLICPQCYMDYLRAKSKVMMAKAQLEGEVNTDDQDGKEQA